MKKASCRRMAEFSCSKLPELRAGKKIKQLYTTIKDIKLKRLQMHNIVDT